MFCEKEDDERWERELTLPELVADSLRIIFQQATVYTFTDIARFFPNVQRDTTLKEPAQECQLFAGTMLNKYLFMTSETDYLSEKFEIDDILYPHIKNAIDKKIFLPHFEIAFRPYSFIDIMDFLDLLARNNNSKFKAYNAYLFTQAIFILYHELQNLKAHVDLEQLGEIFGDILYTFADVELEPLDFDQKRRLLQRACYFYYVLLHAHPEYVQYLHQDKIQLYLGCSVTFVKEYTDDPTYALVCYTKDVAKNIYSEHVSSEPLFQISTDDFINCDEVRRDYSSDTLYETVAANVAELNIDANENIMNPLYMYKA